MSKILGFFGKREKKEQNTQKDALINIFKEIDRHFENLVIIIKNRNDDNLSRDIDELNSKLDKIFRTLKEIKSGEEYNLNVLRPLSEAKINGPYTLKNIEKKREKIEFIIHYLENNFNREKLKKAA